MSGCLRRRRSSGYSDNKKHWQGPGKETSYVRKVSPTGKPSKIILRALAGVRQAARRDGSSSGVMPVPSTVHDQKVARATVAATRETVWSRRRQQSQQQKQQQPVQWTGTNGRGGDGSSGGFRSRTSPSSSQLPAPSTSSQPAISILSFSAAASSSANVASAC
eukprot:914908-Rhodomonas_salina.3